MSPKTRKIAAVIIAILFLVGGTVYAGSIVLMSSGPRGELRTQPRTGGDASEAAATPASREGEQKRGAPVDGGASN